MADVRMNPVSQERSTPEMAAAEAPARMRQPPGMLELPRNHPQRILLNDEVHARPPERLKAPSRVTYLALLANPAQRADAWDRLTILARDFGASLPGQDGAHYSADFGKFRLQSERHTEFIRFQFIQEGLGENSGSDPFANPAIAAVPAEWLAVLPGELLVATHAAILPGANWPPEAATLTRYFAATDALLGASIAGGAGGAFTDLRIREDGFGRLLVFDRGMTPGQIGRALQRLLEMDTYRMMALLALPVARALMPALSASQQELSSVTTAMVNAAETDDPELLERLTKLSAQIESRQSETQFRFGAAASYYDLVQRRINELREERIEGIQTLREFMERRLAPAMSTCRSVTARQEALSEGVARATELLSTRVELSSERQSQALLASMNRRAHMQLRLQETVEGLSVAAITYYIVGLVGHAAEGLEAGGLPVNPALAMGIAIPVVAVLVALGVRRIRKKVTGSDRER
jgi:uncharacterized membrane-anchored protein